MINFSLWPNCDLRIKGIFYSKEMENPKLTLCRFLPLTWQQVDLNLLILSQRRLYCPSVFALFHAAHV